MLCIVPRSSARHHKHVDFTPFNSILKTVISKAAELIASNSFLELFQNYNYQFKKKRNPRTLFKDKTHMFIGIIHIINILFSAICASTWY